MFLNLIIDPHSVSLEGSSTLQTESKLLIILDSLSLPREMKEGDMLLSSLEESSCSQLSTKDSMNLLLLLQDGLVIELKEQSQELMLSYWNFVLSRPLKKNENRVVLSWSSVPRDLDTKLLMPRKERVNFRRRKSRDGVLLDTDNRKGF